MLLAERQIDRYSRQIILPELGARGQRRLLDSTVAVTGAGRAARTAILYLVAAGVGCVEWFVEDLGPTRTWAAEASDLNPDVRIDVHEAGRFQQAAPERFDVVVDSIGDAAVRRSAGGPGHAIVLMKPRTESDPLSAAEANVLGALAAMQVVRVLLGLQAAAVTSLDFEARNTSFGVRTEERR